MGKIQPFVKRFFLSIRQSICAIQQGDRRLFHITHLSLIAGNVFLFLYLISYKEFWNAALIFLSLVFVLYAKQEPERMQTIFNRRNAKVFILWFLLLECGLRLILGNMGIVKTVFNPPDGRCIGLAPGTSTTYTGWLWRVPAVQHDVNRFGYRGKPRPHQKPLETFRIALLGDSFAYGQGVESDETMAVYLETFLAQKLKTSVEVLNFGIPGAGLLDYPQQFERFASRWEPDLALLLLYGNDLEPSLCEHVPGAHPLGFLVYIAITKIYTTRPFLFLTNLHFGPPYPEQKQAEKAVKRELKKLKTSTKKNGAKLAVVALGVPMQKKERLRGILDHLSVPYLPASEWLNSKSRHALPRIPRERHFSKEGNEQAAQRLADWLLSRRIITRP